MTTKKKNMRVAMVMELFRKEFPGNTISIVNIDDEALEVYVFNEDGMVKKNFLIYHSVPKEEIYKFLLR